MYAINWGSFMLISISYFNPNYLLWLSELSSAVEWKCHVVSQQLAQVFLLVAFLSKTNTGVV